MPVIVFMGHAAIWTGAIPMLRPVFMAGGLAVDVFIFISGFLMLWHYLDRKQREPWSSVDTWKRFWIRRFFRMAPLYWLVLTAVYLSYPHLTAWIEDFHRHYPPPWAGRLPETGRIDTELGAANIISHYTFLFGFIPRFASNNPLPDWSIGLEMQFYLFFPFIALAIGRFKWLLTSAGLAAIWIVTSQQISIGLLNPDGPWGWFPMPTFLPLRIGLFLCGMLAAGALLAPRNMPRFFAFMGASVAIALWHNKWLAVPVIAFYSWEGLARSGGIRPFQTRMVSLGNRFLRSRFVQFIADCSYGVYLWHVPVQLCAMRLLQDFGWFDGRSVLGRFGLLCATALPCVYLLSWLSHRFVEQPGIALGKRFLGQTPASRPPLRAA